MNNSNIAIILVKPQLGENIGAAARAMKNFALSDLRIIAPRDGWPNDKADAMSVGAIDVIKSAKLYDTLEHAISDLNYVYATTGQRRDLNKDYISSYDISEEFTDKGKIGILFGRESAGLTNDEVSLANKILTIDTVQEFSSLNIAHAVCVVCHDLFKAKDFIRKDLDNKQILATKDELRYCYEHLISSLDSRGFFKSEEKKAQMTMKIKNIFHRIDKLSSSELKAIRGIITCL